MHEREYFPFFFFEKFEVEVPKKNIKTVKCEAAFLDKVC